MPYKGYIKLIYSLFREILFYWGWKYHCPYCNGHFRKMLPGGIDIPVLTAKEVIGGGLRLNCFCPRCSSTDRERLLLIYLKFKSDLFSRKRVKLLHIAPEPNLRELLLSSSNICYYSGDRFTEHTAYPIDTIPLDILNLPFKDSLFDVILCNHVLEHIPQDTVAISEIFRAIKPGGWAILQVPISQILTKTLENNQITSPEDRERFFGQFNHVRIYGRDYKNRLDQTGFNVEVFNMAKEYGEDFIKRYAVNVKEDLYIAFKQNVIA